MTDEQTKAPTRGMARPPMRAVSDPLGAARSLVRLIREAAPASERARRVPLDIIDALRDAGLFYMLTPRMLGGAEVDPVLAAQVVEEIAAADVSTGGVVMLAMQSNALAGFMEERRASRCGGTAA